MYNVRYGFGECADGTRVPEYVASGSLGACSFWVTWVTLPYAEERCRREAKNIMSFVGLLLRALEAHPERAARWGTSPPGVARAGQGARR